MRAVKRVWLVLIVVALLMAGCQQAEPTGAPEEPAVEEPAEVPATEEPSDEEPATEEPADEEPAAEEPVQVTIAHGGSVIGVDHPGQYIPLALGWYEEEGLDVTLIPAGGSNQALQLLIAGEADIIQIATDVLPLGRQEGVDLVSFYVPVTRSNARIGVPADSEYEDITDLVGATIGVPAAASSHVDHVRALAGQAGIDADTEMTMVPTGFNPAEAGQALRSNNVDALAYWSGFFASLEVEGFEFRYFVWEPLLQAPGHVVVATREYIEQNPEVVARVARSMARAAVYAFANPEAAVRAYWAAFPESRPSGDEEAALQAEVHRLNTQLMDMTVEGREDTRWGWNDPAGWQIQLDFMLDAGVLEEAMSAEEVYTNEFIDEANDFDAAEVEALAAEGFEQ